MYNNGINITSRGYFTVGESEIYPNREAFEKIGFKFTEKSPHILKFTWPEKYTFMGTRTGEIKIVCDGETVGIYYTAGKLEMMV